MLVYSLGKHCDGLLSGVLSRHDALRNRVILTNHSTHIVLIGRNLVLKVIARLYVA